MESTREDWTVLSITVRVRTRDGTERTAEIDPANNDAFFWSLDAADKFLVPFYSATKGFEYASNVRDLIKLIPVLHKRLCKPDPLFRDPRYPMEFPEW
jgi:hypothetical protein